MDTTPAAAEQVALARTAVPDRAAEVAGAETPAPAPDVELRRAAAASYEGGPRAVGVLGRLMAGRPDGGAHVAEVRRMVGEEWPDGDLTVVAREVATGERRLFRRGEAPLHLAVAGSSAAAGRTGAVTIDGGQYIDGGYGSLLNADLAGARGAGRVWVPAPAGLGSFTPETVPARMRAELDALRATGAEVEVFLPQGAFPDLGDFAEAARALDDGAQVARTRLARL
ncbi:hypothetical protein [Streptomyces sp. NPDC097619]|uniref:hypothetical protein n=1 Tax=Streptomyces sp. NPDC097619 TaxID=3157228 RepID=UPI003316C8DE